MDLAKKINRIVGLILLLTIFGIDSPSILAKTTAPASTSVWEQSYNFELNKKYAEAANVLKPVYNKSPKDELVLIRLGWLNYLLGQYNVSIDYYGKALAVNSDSIDARLGLTLPLLAQQRWKEAAVYANQIIAVSAWDFTAHTRLMICESGLSQWEVLEKHATEFIKRYPSDSAAFIMLARSQAMLGKKEQATENYKLALLRAPTNAEALKYIKK